MRPQDPVRDRALIWRDQHHQDIQGPESSQAEKIEEISEDRHRKADADELAQEQDKRIGFTIVLADHLQIMITAAQALPMRLDRDQPGHEHAGKEQQYERDPVHRRQQEHWEESAEDREENEQPEQRRAKGKAHIDHIGIAMGGII